MNDDGRRRVGQAPGNWEHGISKSEVENFHVSRRKGSSSRLGKIFQNLEKKLGMSFNQRNIFDGLTWGLFFSFFDENSHPPWCGFLDEFGNVQKHRI